MGKRKGRRPSEALTVQFVRDVQAPGFYADRNNLYLRVDASGTKRWVLRIVVQGRRRDFGLGGFSYTSLVEARVRAKILGKIAREWGDPLVTRAELCRTELPEITEARNQVIELLEKAGVALEPPALSRLRRSQSSIGYGPHTHSPLTRAPSPLRPRHRRGIALADLRRSVSGWRGKRSSASDSPRSFAPLLTQMDRVSTRRNLYHMSPFPGVEQVASDVSANILLLE